jgi:hypothetical protein
MRRELGACAVVFIASAMAREIDQVGSPASGFSEPQHWTGLPADAKVLEYRELPPSAHTNRALILWMIDPQEFRVGNGEPYTCPGETRGSFFRGPTRISLVDTTASTIINTVEIRGDEGETSPDEFDIPYLIHRKYYRVDRRSSSMKDTP